MNWIISIWRDWVMFTKMRAEAQAYINEHIYGNGIVKKCWWGYKSIHPKDFIK